MHAKDVIRVGLIGAGRIGQLHADNVAARLPEFKLAAVADVQRSAAEAVAAKHGLTTVATDYRHVLDLPDVDAVLICSATDTHAAISQDAAQAGKHIFCEKPIDFDLARIDQTLAAVEAAGVKFQVGFNRRFDPNFKKVRDLVADGEIGEPHLLRITSRDPAPPPLDYIKVSGGMFLDMTIHDFDMARYLIGSEVREIYAAGGVLVDPQIGAAGDIDTAIVMLRFENGVIGAIDNSRQAVYGYDQRVEVFGSKGMIATGNETPDQHVLSDAKGIHSALPLYFFLERYTESYVQELKAFATCIQEEAPPPVTGLDGRMPVVIGRAAQRSLKEGRPVRLSEMASGS